MGSLKKDRKNCLLIVASHLSTKNLGVKTIPTIKKFKNVYLYWGKVSCLFIYGYMKSNLRPGVHLANTSV